MKALPLFALAVFLSACAAPEAPPSWRTVYLVHRTVIPADAGHGHVVNVWLP